MGIGGAHPGHRVGTGFSLSALDAALALFIAPACASCGDVLESPLSGPICDHCWNAVPPLALAWRTPGGVQVDAAAAYDGSLRNIIHAWKFERRESLARRLALIAAERCGDALADADVVVPVPLTPWRRWHRGFNQADDLAARLALPRRRALARWRPRRAQSTLHVDARRRNLEGVLFVPSWHRAAIRDRAILLIDDVVTTGATIDACAVALRAGGARDVRALVVARTLKR